MPTKPRLPLRIQKKRRERDDDDDDEEREVKRTALLIIKQLEVQGNEHTAAVASPVSHFVQMLFYFVRAIDDPAEQDRKGSPQRALTPAAYQQFMRFPLLADASANNDTWGPSGCGKLQAGVTDALDAHPIHQIELLRERPSGPCTACGEVQLLTHRLTLDGRAYNLERELAATVVVESQRSAVAGPVTLLLCHCCCPRLCVYHDTKHFVLRWLLQRESLKTVSGITRLIGEIGLSVKLCR